MDDLRAESFHLLSIRFLSSLAALLLNASNKISSGFALPLATRYPALPTIVLVLPVPAPASTKLLSLSVIHASRCLSVNGLLSTVSNSVLNCSVSFLIKDDLEFSRRLLFALRI